MEWLWPRKQQSCFSQGWFLLMWSLCLIGRVTCLSFSILPRRKQVNYFNSSCGLRVQSLNSQLHHSDFVCSWWGHQKPCNVNDAPRLVCGNTSYTSASRIFLHVQIENCYDTKKGFFHLNWSVQTFWEFVFAHCTGLAEWIPLWLEN